MPRTAKNSSPTCIVFNTQSQLSDFVVRMAPNATLMGFCKHPQAEGIKDIVTASVAGNTFRAFQFRRWNIEGLTPSGLYRNWTTERFTADEKDIRKLDCQEAMEAYVIRTANDLDRHWRTEVASKLAAQQREAGTEALGVGFGRAAKLLTLTLKHLLWLKWEDKERDAYIRALNVPLDSFTLQAIRLICIDLRISEKASMKFVETVDQYAAIQKAIRGLLPEGYLPIHYELAIWNGTHPNVIGLRPPNATVQPVVEQRLQAA